MKKLYLIVGAVLLIMFALWPVLFLKLDYHKPSPEELELAQRIIDSDSDFFDFPIIRTVLVDVRHEPYPNELIFERYTFFGISSKVFICTNSKGKPIAGSGSIEHGCGG